jgi:multiple sugar transport system permease protein
LQRLADSEAVWPLAVGASALFLAFFIGYPILYNLLMSFQQVSMGNLAQLDRPWVGLDNYRKLVADPLFARVAWQTFVFVAANVVVQFVLGLSLALFFERDFPGRGFLRGVFLAGWILPPLVIGAVWKWMLASDGGVVNHLLQVLGLVNGATYWLSDPKLALGAVTATNIWFGLPFTMILLAAGLAGIPRDLYEAAALDGANARQRFWFITLPLLRPTIYAVLAIGTIYTMRAFDIIWTMTHGGPVDASNIFPLWSYMLSFEQFNFGAGAAISTLMLAVVFAVAVVYVRSVRAEERAA